ncbi:hypothetical protein [Spirulina sp. 06S082]|uniref:hypothetical protein n=1 Tax=Spirulina sp. 06S082 TaxID=3110248 RepID=UPI002B1FBE7D|nr:hypothetical protein [Spirulina sp. 06S082]MEA5472084.1 hypothetical protein [Spirulina sp. 06S082]
MLTADELSLISRQLKPNPTLASELLEIFQDIFNNPQYQQWLKSEQFLGQLFEVDEKYRDHEFFNKNGLVKDGKLQVKINSLQDRIFLTDGLWIPKQYRVFPFSDESVNLLRHMEEKRLDEIATTLIDFSCGCGHHGLSVSEIQQRYSFDVSHRAVIYTLINSILNEIPNVFIKQNDIRGGIPKELSKLVTRNILFLTNMPFAIAPLPNVLPLAADGGITGATWSFKALEAIHKFAMNNLDKDSIHASMLCYTVGNKQQDKWEVIDKAEQLFGKSKVSWKLLEDQTMWRINGKKEQPNPMNLAEGLAKKADCKFYVSDEDRERVRTEYHNLAKSLNNSDWEYLGYGIIDIRL